MAGLSLSTGLTGSVFSNGYPGYGGSYASAAVPVATTVPEGPSTITQAAWGVPGAGGGGRKGLAVAGIGTLALVALGFLWWSLPR